MDDVETRTVLALRTGTKICVLIGLAFIVLAIYFFVVPITSVRTTSGAVFGCGTAMSPSHGSFADGVCWRVADANRYRAFAALAVGLITIVAGGALFGVDRREEQRHIPHDHHGLRGADLDDQRLDRDWPGERRARRERYATEPDDEPGRRHNRRDDIDGRSGQPGTDYRRYDDEDDERSSRRRETDDLRDDSRERRRSIPGDR